MGEDFSVWKLDESFVVDPEEFLSMGRATPFAGESLYGICVMTVKDGQVVYRADL
jgi:dihydroorotase